MTKDPAPPTPRQILIESSKIRSTWPPAAFRQHLVGQEATHRLLGEMWIRSTGRMVDGQQALLGIRAALATFEELLPDMRAIAYWSTDSTALLTLNCLARLLNDRERRPGECEVTEDLLRAELFKPVEAGLKAFLLGEGPAPEPLCERERRK